jgi:hypothetical protein
MGRTESWEPFWIREDRVISSFWKQVGGAILSISRIESKQLTFLLSLAVE